MADELYPAGNNPDEWSVSDSPAGNNPDESDWGQSISNSADVPNIYNYLSAVTGQKFGDGPKWSTDGSAPNLTGLPTSADGPLSAANQSGAKSEPSFWSSIFGQKSDTIQAKIIESLLAGIGGLAKGKRESRALDLKQEEIRIAAEAQALKDKQVNNAMTSASNLNVGILGRRPAYDSGLYSNTMSNRKPVRFS